MVFCNRPLAETIRTVWRTLSFRQRRCFHRGTIAHFSSLANASAAPTISIAPMVNVTDESFRHFARILSKRVTLFTPMIVDQAVLHADDTRSVVRYTQDDEPIVAQIGGRNYESLRGAIAAVTALGFTRVNINFGCPAPSAQTCEYGVVLMSDETMIDVVRRLTDDFKHIEISIKCRLGYSAHGESDVRADYDFLQTFVHRMCREANVRHFVIHCRHAVLNFSTSQNRTAPPLMYQWYERITKEFTAGNALLPHCNFTLNGGINDETNLRLWYEKNNQNVMIGRWAWKDTYNALTLSEQILAKRADPFMSALSPPISRLEALQSYRQYIIEHSSHTHTPNLIRPLHYVATAQRYAKIYRTAMMECLRQQMSAINIVDTLQRIVEYAEQRHQHYTQQHKQHNAEYNEWMINVDQPTPTTTTLNMIQTEMPS